MTDETLLDAPDIDQQVQQQDGGGDPPSKQLWQKLYDSKAYTNSYEDFQKRYATTQDIDLLYQKLSDSRAYTNSKDDFYNKYFSDLASSKKKEIALPSFSGGSTNGSNGFSFDKSVPQWTGTQQQNGQPSQQPSQSNGTNPNNGVKINVPNTSQQNTQQPKSLSDFGGNEDPIGTALTLLQSKKDNLINTHSDATVVVHPKLVNINGKGFIQTPKEDEINSLDNQIQSIKQNAFTDANEAKNYLKQKLVGKTAVAKNDVAFQQPKPITPNSNLDDFDLNSLKQNLTPGNATEQLAFDSFQKEQNVKEALITSSNINEAAIKYAASQNPAIKKQIDFLQNNGEKLPQAYEGAIVQNFLNNPDVQRAAQSNPNFASVLNQTQRNLYYQYPEFGKKIVAQKISQAREDSGMNNPVLNIPTADGTDKVVDALYKAGKLNDTEKSIYEKSIRPSLGIMQSIGRGIGRLIPGVQTAVDESPITTPGFFENTENSYVNTLHGMAHSAEDLGSKTLLGKVFPFPTDADRLSQSLKNDYSNISINPNGAWNELGQGTGNMTGFILPMIMGGAATKAVGLSANTGELITNGLMFEGQNKDASLKMFPDNPTKQFLYTTLATSGDMMLGKLIPTKEAQEGVSSLLHNDIKRVINNLTDGKITEAAARNTILQKATDYVGKVVKGNLHTGTAMAGFGLLHNGLDAAFGGRDVSMGDAANEAIQNFKTGFLGSTLISGMAALGGNAKLNGKVIREMAESPQHYATVITDQAKLNPYMAATKDEKLNNLADAVLINNDLNKTNLTDAQKEKYIIQALAQKVWEHKAEGTTDNVIKKSYLDKAKERQKSKENIFSGLDQATEHEQYSSPVQKEGDAPQSVTPKNTLSPELQAVQDKFRKDLTDNYEERKAQYHKEFGNVINADNAKTLSEDYNKNPTATTSAIHPPSSEFATRLYNDALKEKPETGTVLMTTGGTGAGKSTAVKGLADNKNYDVVFDTNLLDQKDATHKIDNALKSGRNVDINYVYRDPIKAFTEGVYPRMKYEKYEGRPVNIDYHLGTHEKALNTIEKLQEHYKDNPNVKIHIIDNSGKIGEQKLSNLDEVKKNNYLSKDANEQLNNFTDEKLQSGEISPEQYRSITSKTINERGVQEPVQRGTGKPNSTGDGGIPSQPGQSRQNEVEKNPPSNAKKLLDLLNKEDDGEPKGTNVTDQEQTSPRPTGQGSDKTGEGSDIPTKPKGSGKIKTFKKRAKPTIKSPLYKKALDVESEDPHSQVLKYFIGGGKIHTDAINKLFDNSKGEKKARIGLIKNNAPKTTELLGEYLWDNSPEHIQEKYDSRDFINAVEDVLNNHNSRTSMAEELVKHIPLSDDEKAMTEWYDKTYGGYEEEIPEENFNQAIDIFEGLSDEEKQAIIDSETEALNDSEYVKQLAEKYGINIEDSGDTEKPKISGNENYKTGEEENVKRAQSDYDKAKIDLRNAEDKISKKQATQTGLFGDAAQTEMFGVGRDEAKEILDPLRQKVKETKSVLDKANIDLENENTKGQPELFEKDHPQSSTFSSTTDKVGKAVEYKGKPHFVERKNNDGTYQIRSLSSDRKNIIGFPKLAKEEELGEILPEDKQPLFMLGKHVGEKEQIARNIVADNIKNGAKDLNEILDASAKELGYKSADELPEKYRNLVEDAYNEHKKSLPEEIHTPVIDRIKKTFGKLINGVTIYKNGEETLKAAEQYSNPKFNLVGEKANLPEEKKAALSLANELDKKKVTPDKIWAATGWEKDAKGRWQTDSNYIKIPNTLIKLFDKAQHGEEVSGKLGDLVDLGELGKLYPELNGLQLEFFNDKTTNNYGELQYLQTRDGKPIKRIFINTRPDVAEVYNTSGYYRGERPSMFDERGNRGRVESEPVRGEDSRYGDTQLKQLITHEVQHWIQEKEGWDKGANLQKEISSEKSKYLNNLHQQAIVERGNGNIKEANNLENTVKQLQQTTPSQIADTKWNNPHAQEIYRNAYENYLNEPGEIQARNSAIRAALTPEERAAKPISETADTKFMYSPKGEVLGFTAPDGSIHLNGEKINGNTPVHEAGHVWLKWVEQNHPELHQKGLSLVENSKYLKSVKANEDYIKQADDMGLTGNQREDFFKNEALATAIGDKGEKFILQSQKNNFKAWLNNLWDSIKQHLGIRDLTTKQIQDLTLDEFSKKAAADILSGDEIKLNKAEEKFANRTLKNNERVERIIEEQGLTLETLEANKEMFQKFPFTKDDYQNLKDYLNETGRSTNEPAEAGQEASGNVNDKDTGIKSKEMETGQAKDTPTEGTDTSGKIQPEGGAAKGTGAEGSDGELPPVGKVAFARSNSYSAYKILHPEESIDDYNKVRTSDVDIPTGDLRGLSKEYAFNKKVDDAVNKIIDKITPKHFRDVNKQGAGIDTVVRAAAKIVKETYRIGNDINDVIDKAIKYIKDNWNDAWGEFDKDREDETRKLLLTIPKTKDDFKDDIRDARKKNVGEDEIKKDLQKEGLSDEDANDLMETVSREGLTDAEKRAKTKQDLKNIAKKEPPVAEARTLSQKIGDAIPVLLKPFKSIINAFHPFAFDKTGDLRKAYIDIRQKNAALDQAITQLEDGLKKQRTFWMKIPRIERESFILSMENPELHGNVDPKFASFAAEYRKQFDHAFDLIKEHKDINALQDYFSHFWKDPVKAEKVLRQINGKKPLEGNKSFLKKRFYSDILQGKKAGLKLATDNPAEIVGLAVKNALRFNYAHNILASMKESGVIKYIDDKNNVPDGWVKIKNDNLFAPKIQDKISPSGYYAPEAVATGINNFTGKGIFDAGGFVGGFGKTVRYYNNLKNMFQLGVSPYHALTTSIESSVNGVQQGIQNFTTFRPELMVRGLGKVVESTAGAPIRLIKMAISGNRIKSDYAKGRMTTDVKNLIEAGGRTKMTKMYSLDAGYNVKKAWFAMKTDGDAPVKNMLKLIGNSVGLVPELIGKPIMNHWVSALKIAGHAEALKNEIMRKPAMSAEEYAKTTQRLWDDMDDSLGQVVYDNVFWNKAVKDLGFDGVRSLGWSGGTIKKIGKGLGGVVDSFVDIKNTENGLQAGKGRLLKGQGLNPRTAWLISLPFTVGLFGGMYHYLMTGQQPQTLDDYFHPKDGTKNEDGTDYRVNIPSYLKDIEGYRKDPYTTLGNKLAPSFHEAKELLNNKDFYGTQIYNPDDEAYQKGLDILKYEAQTMEPFSFRKKVGSEPDNQQKIEKFFGLMPAPKSIGRTDTENRISLKIQQKYANEDARTEDSREMTDARTSIINQLHAGKKWEDIDQKIKDKANYSENKVDDLIDNAGLNPFYNKFKNLNPKDQIQIWKDMTDEEKKNYAPYIHSDETLDAIEKADPGIFDTHPDYKGIIKEMEDFHYKY